MRAKYETLPKLISNATQGEDVEDMLNAINATINTKECKEHIIPWRDGCRLHYTMNETSNPTKKR